MRGLRRLLGRDSWALTTQDGWKNVVNILFICSRNQWRSPTAEAVWKDHPAVSARSAGTSRNARRTLRIEDLRWADVVCVMEEKHKSRVRSEYPRASKYLRIEVLDIPDEYRFMDADLIRELKTAVLPIVQGA